MIEYIVGARETINDYPKNRLMQSFLIFILLLLIGGFVISTYFVTDAWLKGGLCKNRSDLPLVIFSLILYFQGIIWFTKYPFMEYESIRKLYM